MKPKRIAMFCLAVVLGACASSTPKVPYPAFIETDARPEVFMASLPGVRARQLAGDSQTRRTSNRIDLPLDWQGTSGGVPGRSMEIVVLEGKLSLADIELGPGGYAFLPAGSLGFNLTAKEGAQILYFVNDADPESVIRSPIIIDSGLLTWQASDIPGVSKKMLREDPGSGARSWLQRISSGAQLPWTSSTAIREGYLMAGTYQDAECVNGEAQVGQYLPGGYFYRPAETSHGGPEAMAITESIWFMRETAEGEDVVWPECGITPSPVS